MAPYLCRASDGGPTIQTPATGTAPVAPFAHETRHAHPADGCNVPVARADASWRPALHAEPERSAGRRVQAADRFYPTANLSPYASGRNTSSRLDVSMVMGWVIIDRQPCPFQHPVSMAAWSTRPCLTGAHALMLARWYARMSKGAKKASRPRPYGAPSTSPCSQAQFLDCLAAGENPIPADARREINAFLLEFDGTDACYAR
jgi:hypothetical protein